jgi:hypothetical protein
MHLSSTTYLAAAPRKTSHFSHELPDVDNTASDTTQRTNESNSVTLETLTVDHALKDLNLIDPDVLYCTPQTAVSSIPELVCPINADDISNRWLNTYIPVPGQKIKNYPPSIIAFLYRILKSYAAISVRGREVPPFIHSSQNLTKPSQTPLSTCFAMIQTCQNQVSDSPAATADALQKEMNSLYEQQHTYDDMTLLEAFQAHLIYSLVLFFVLGQGSNAILREAMTQLQDLASSSSKRGLVCVAEQLNTLPKWEAWIVAEAKRRTLYTMYLFDSVLSAQDGLPSFLGIELRGLPAPTSKSLWSAKRRQQWEAEYNRHLADWKEESLCIDELWPLPTSLDESGLTERRGRVDRWLENVDGFGTMLYAVTSCTHGG